VKAGALMKTTADAPFRAWMTSICCYVWSDRELHVSGACLRRVALETYFVCVSVACMKSAGGLKSHRVVKSRSAAPNPLETHLTSET